MINWKIATLDFNFAVCYSYAYAFGILATAWIIQRQGVNLISLLETGIFVSLQFSAGSKAFPQYGLPTYWTCDIHTQKKEKLVQF